MDTVFSVLLLICAAGQPCDKDTARMKLDGFFVNASGSVTPCEDWLFSQLEYNSILVREATNITIHFECKPKEK